MRSARRFSLISAVGGCWLATFVTAPASPEDPGTVRASAPPQLLTHASVASSELLSFVRTVQVTPDASFASGAGGYVHYLPDTDRLLVILSPELVEPVGGSTSGFLAYKEYTTEMAETGGWGVIGASAADGTSLLIGRRLYVVHMEKAGDTIGWRLNSYDAVTWTGLADVFIPLDFPKEQDNGPTISLVGGNLDVTGEYFPDGIPEDTRFSHHHFFTLDLAPLGKKIVSDVPHTPEVGIIEADGLLFMLAATSYFGDLMVMTYDSEWTCLGSKVIQTNGRFPVGVVDDGRRFYVAYLDTLYPNAHLAAFDREWNLLEDIAVTDVDEADNLRPDSAWVMLHDGRLYVSYVVDSLDPVTHQEQRQWQAYVSVFDIVQPSVTVTAPNGGESWQAGSTQGITWTSTGGIESVTIELSTAGSSGPFAVVTPSTPDTGSYSLTVPDTASSSCFVRVSDTASAAFDSSDIAFQIVSCDHPGLSSDGAQMHAGGGTGTVQVTAGDGCAWTAASGVPWIAIESGAAGIGSGEVRYTVAPKSSSAPRTGTLTIGGNTFSLRQGGARPSGVTLIRTGEVTPNGNLTGGSFARVYDAPTPGRLLVTFQAPLAQAEGDCSSSAHAYVELDTDLQETGRRGMISCRGGGDIGSLLFGNSYYLATMDLQGAQQGWAITAYDPTSWAKKTEIFRALDYPKEVDNDPMVALVNGNIDFSSQYNVSGTFPGLGGAASFHYLFSPDLQLLGEVRLSDTPHVHGSSMLVVDGVTHFVAANAYLGDLVVMRYDAAWHFLGAKTLVTNGLFSEGLAYDGQRFYLAYLDTSLRTDNHMPLSLNVRLGIFDRNWDLVDDIAITSYGWEDLKQPGRPYLLLRGDRLYVSYDCDTIDPITHQEQLEWQAYVAMLEVGPSRPRPVRRHLGGVSSR